MSDKQKTIIIVLCLLLAVFFYWNKKKSDNDKNSAQELQVINELPPPAAQESAPEESQENVSETNAPTSTEIQEIPEAVKKIRAKLKVNLSSAYMSEKAFFAENGYYSTDFNALGFDPSLEKGTFLFKMGFLESYFNEEDMILGDKMIESTEDIVGIFNPDTQQPLKYAPQAEKIQFSDLKKYCKKSCSASADSFEVIIATNLDEDETLDVWLINQNKELEHVSDDFLK